MDSLRAQFLMSSTLIDRSILNRAEQCQNSLRVSAWFPLARLVPLVPNSSAGVPLVCSFQEMDDANSKMERSIESLRDHVRRSNAKATQLTIKIKLTQNSVQARKNSTYINLRVGLSYRPKVVQTKTATVWPSSRIWTPFSLILDVLNPH